MARRSTTSTFEQIIYIGSVIPWWVSLPLAVIIYFYLSSLAVMPQIDPQKPMAHLQGSMLYYLAYWLRFIIPLALVFGAIKSFLDSRKRHSLLADVRYSTGAASNTLSTVSWREFEMLVGQFFREKGYKVDETAIGADGGVDLRLTASDFKTYLVQCKHWKASKVPVNVVRELYGVMVAEHAAGAFVVTSGQFTEDAAAFAEGKNILLVDGQYLVGAIKQAGPSNQKPVLSTVRAGVTCPVCNSDMVLRTAKKGANAGNQFYGCTSYPGCRGIRNIK